MEEWLRENCTNPSSGILAGPCVAVLVWLAGSASAQVLKPDDPVDASLGKDVYTEHCASCHGENLEGQENWKSPGPDGLLPAPPHDETGHTWHHSEKLLFNLTKFGLAEVAGLKDHKTNMPVYKDVLSDADIIAVLSYIKSRWPKDLQDRHTEMSAHDQ